MGETVDAIGYKADVTARAKDAVTERTNRIAAVKERLVGKVAEALPSGDQAGQSARQAASVAQQNPLGLAVGATAVGFLAGMLVPSTEIENERIGPAADRVKEQAKSTGQEALERGKDVAQQAAESAVETAKEQGRRQGQDLASNVQETPSIRSPGD
jgi:hypothetical protein